MMVKSDMYFAIINRIIKFSFIDWEDIYCIIDKQNSQFIYRVSQKKLALFDLM
jgi:hypothetical protein